MSADVRPVDDQGDEVLVVVTADGLRSRDIFVAVVPPGGDEEAWREFLEEERRRALAERD